MGKSGTLLARTTAPLLTALLAVSAAPGGAASAAPAPATASLPSTLTSWARTPATPTGAAALRASARSVLADPLATLSAGAATVTVSPVAADPALATFPPAFAAAVTGLEQAAADARALAARATAGVSAAELTQLARDAHSLTSDVTGLAGRIRDAAERGDRDGAIRARDAAAARLEQSLPTADRAIAQRIDTATLAAGAAALQRAAHDATVALAPLAGSPQWRGPDAAPAGTTTVSCRRPGPIYCDDDNLVEVWGTEDDTYRDDSVASIRIDLGGNDTYLDHTGSAVGDTSNCSFDSGSLPSSGCASAFAVRANVDVAGDDTYGTDVGQGTGIVGIGVLSDGAGRDQYGALVGQGFSIIGAGVLTDTGAGNDTYGSLAFGQGVGVAAGTGVLTDDGGDDTYGSLAGAQGVGLVGAGLLADGAGNDVYHCLAICQGSTLIGAGTVLDGAGNDQYLGLDLFGFSLPGVVTQGVALGLGEAALVDLAGNDRYGAYDLGMGVAQSADLATALLGTPQTDTYAVLFDGSGTDTYWTAGTTTFGIATGYAYARFWDTGTGTDTYTSLNGVPGNNRTWVQSDGHSTWVAGYDLGTPNGMGQDN